MHCMGIFVACDGGLGPPNLKCTQGSVPVPVPNLRHARMELPWFKAIPVVLLSRMLCTCLLDTWHRTGTWPCKIRQAAQTVKASHSRHGRTPFTSTVVLSPLSALLVLPLLRMRRITSLNIDVAHSG